MKVRLGPVISFFNGYLSISLNFILDAVNFIHEKFRQ